VIENNELMVFYILCVLQVNEVMRASCVSLWLLGSNLEDSKFPTLIQE
jgi:hypothetical protein